MAFVLQLPVARYWGDDDASFEASLVVARAGGAALAVSVVAGLLAEGVAGADATDGSAVGAGVEGVELEAVEIDGVGLEADSVFTGVGL